MIIWLTTPTAATRLSEWRRSMMVSTAPSIMMRSVSIKMLALIHIYRVVELKGDEIYRNQCAMARNVGD